MKPTSVSIERLGAKGDGVVMIDGRPVYVPFALPGEDVTILRKGDRGRLVSIDRPALNRMAPACRHFGTEQRCGGCSLQHLAPADYQAWKRQNVIDALADRGIETDVADLIVCKPGSRRRAVLTARRVRDGLQLGYNQAGSHAIVPIDHCPVMAKPLEDRLNDLKALARLAATDTKPFRVNVLSTASGLDVSLLDRRLRDKQRQAIIDLTLRRGFARLSLEDEILIEPHKPVLDFSGIAVTPPPGAFVQASLQAENTMADIVLQHLEGSRKCADLFAGCGAFALRLARQASVRAVEAETAALQALDRAARHHPGLKPVGIERRDLFRSPLQPEDFKPLDAVIFDPPRAGAEAQCRALAKSTITKVAAVSCNPMTLARDLRILIDGGFKLLRVTPIDQFLWSPHVEAVALLERG